MSHGQPVRTASGLRRAPVLVALAIISAALVGLLVDRSSASSGASTGTMPTAAVTAPPSTAPAGSFGPAPDDRPPRGQQAGQQGGQQGALGAADGVVPDGVTVFDDAYPAVANLDPALLSALRAAATAAASDKVTFYVDSGWRSRTYQEQLLREAIAKYGSEAEAARWVATPETSPHVSGDAVDIGGSVASAWLSKHGAVYGLCQIYRNEPWHYELRPDAVDRGCPGMYADPTQDPRMQP